MQEPANDNPQLALARINASLGKVRRDFVQEAVWVTVATFSVGSVAMILGFLFGRP